MDIHPIPLPPTPLHPPPHREDILPQRLTQTNGCGKGVSGAWVSVQHRRPPAQLCYYSGSLCSLQRPSLQRGLQE